MLKIYIVAIIILPPPSCLNFMSSSNSTGRAYEKMYYDNKFCRNIAPVVCISTH